MLENSEHRLTEVQGDFVEEVPMTEDPRDARIRELEAQVAQLQASLTRQQEASQGVLGSQWLDNILRGIQDDFYVIDRDWKFTYASELFTGRIGKRPCDFVGRNIWELFPKHLGTVYEENLRAAMAEREVRRFEVTDKYTSAVYRMTVFPSDEGITVLGSNITAQKSTESALRESQAALQAFYDSSPLMMGITEVWGNKIISVYGNPAVSQFFGLPQEATHNGPTSTLGSPRQVDEIWFQNYRTCQRQGSPVRFEYLHPRDGEDRWISATVSFLGYASSGNARFSFIAEDVTDQRNATEALARSEQAASAHARELDAIIEAIGEGISITDAEGNQLRVNRAGVKLLGYQKPDEYQRRLPSFREMWAVETPDGEPIPFEQWPTNRVLRGETFTEQEHTVRRLDGNLKLTLSHSGTAIRNDKGEIVRAIITYRDITGLVEARQRLSAANAQLIEMDRRKNEFMAMLSHELRNPLAPIINCLAILERAAPSSEQAHRAKQTLNRQVNQLVRLVDDLLDITRITRGKIELQRELIDVNELVRQTLDDHRSLFEQSLVRLEFVPSADAVWVNADPNRMAQAVGNLLQNAAKFTPIGGFVRAQVSIDENAKQAVISVSDTGIGMQPEVLSSLFQAFVQADASIDRSRGGLGLGLALVKGLVELHGGCVQASSAGLHKGSEIVLRLALESGRAQGPQVSSLAPPAACHRVLIIEDNADAADSLCELLELEQHEVAVAYDGPSGIVKLRELKPSVVLCDIGLPGMNGYDVARAIRAEAIPLLCLVALSGYSLREDVQRAKEAGFDRRLSKPPSLSQLKALLAALPSITQV